MYRIHARHGGTKIFESFQPFFNAGLSKTRMFAKRFIFSKATAEFTTGNNSCASVFTFYFTKYCVWSLYGVIYSVVFCPRTLLFSVFEMAIYCTRRKKWRPTITVAGVRRRASTPSALVCASRWVIYDCQ